MIDVKAIGSSRAWDIGWDILPEAMVRYLA